MCDGRVEVYLTGFKAIKQDFEQPGSLNRGQLAGAAFAGQELQGSVVFVAVTIQ